MLNHQHWHYDRHWEWQPIKARKTDVLRFIKDRGTVTALVLSTQFDYKLTSARCRLSQLKREGYVEPLSRGEWCLSNRGEAKVSYINSLSDRVDGEELQREKEMSSLRRSAEELRSRLALIHKGLVRISGEIQPVDAPAAYMARQDPRRCLEYYQGTLTRLQAELEGLIKQSVAR